MRIMYGEESMARERKKEGRALGHKRKKRSHLSDKKNEPGMPRGRCWLLPNPRETKRHRPMRRVRAILPRTRWRPRKSLD